MARQFGRPIITSKVRSSMKTHLFFPVFTKKKNQTSQRENKIIYTFAIFFLSAPIAIGDQWRSYLLVSRHWIHQLHIKLRIILSKRLIAVVVNQFHNWIKRQWIRKAIFSIPMIDLYQLIIATLPVKQYSHSEVLLCTSYPSSTQRLLIKTQVKFLGKWLWHCTPS